MPETSRQVPAVGAGGERDHPDVIALEMNLADNLWKIKEQLEQRSYRIGGYQYFMIYEPKEREIQALSYHDRIIQHSLCDNVLIPFFENHLIYDNCACRKGKGTHFGIKRLEGFMREHYCAHGTRGWMLKVDVRKYFSNIDHKVLLERLEKVIPDEDVLQLLKKMIGS